MANQDIEIEDDTIAKADVDIEGDTVTISTEIQNNADSIQKILAILQSDNVADMLDEFTLAKVSMQIKEDFNQDLDSMQDWINAVEQGQDLMAQEFNARSKPWDNAANFKSPLIMNAVLQFGDTASQELLRKSDLVKGKVIGLDPQGSKEEQSFRSTTFMNYQLNVQMPEWRPEHDRLLYTLPSTGCMFKKTFFDPDKGRNVSDVIFYPNFVVNQSNVTIEDSKSFTQIMQFTENEIVEKERSGEWVERKIMVRDENLEGQPEENPDRFLEQHGWFDLDQDGYKEPYIVTMQESTHSIVKIIPRFMAEDVTVRMNTGDTLSLKDAMGALLQDINDQFSIEQVVSIKPINLLTKYDFIPDPEGEFLGIGYPHLMAGVTMAINTTTNQLLDAGTLSNLPGGYLAKGVRKNLGEDRFQPGEWKQTNVPPRDLGSAFFPLPFKEPSGTLFQLNEKLQAEAQRISASADFSKVLATNAPATTTLALLQKETQATTSIIRRVYLAMAEEFKKMAFFNQRFTDPNMYIQVLQDPQANFQEDFDTLNINYVPIANPEMSTRIERVKQGEALMTFLPQITEAGGQSQVIIQDFLDALGVENIDQIFPQPQPTQLEQQNQLMEQQNALQEFQNQLFDRELVVREKDMERKLVETQGDLVKKHSEALLNLEKAETEDMVNAREIYTTQFNTLANLIQTVVQAMNIKGPNDASSQRNT